MDAYARSMSLMALDINTGNFVRFDSDSTPYEEMIDAVIASGSIPMAFEAHDYG